MAIIDKKQLVEYLKYFHLQKKNQVISPIKLQKTLYFLYAFWAKYVNLAKNGNNTETDFQLKSDDLFNSSFKAWAYGPVDETVYRDFKNKTSYNQSEVDSFIRTTEPEVLEFINSFSVKLFNTSDFGLVDLSHRDKCWINHYKAGVSASISGEEIKFEYGKKS